MSKTKTDTAPAQAAGRKRARRSSPVQNKNKNAPPRRSKRTAPPQLASTPDPPSPASTELTAISDVERELHRAQGRDAKSTSAPVLPPYKRRRVRADKADALPQVSNLLPYPEGFLTDINADLDEITACMCETGAVLDRVLANLGSGSVIGGILEKARMVLDLVERGAGAAETEVAA